MMTAETYLSIILSIIIIFSIPIGLFVVVIIETRNATDDSITIVTCIESQDYFKALNTCRSIKAKKLLKYKNKIIEAIKRRLNYCITYSTYKSGIYWIDVGTIREMYAYKGILKLFPRDEEILKNILVIEKIIELEKFIKWNNYSTKDDDFLSEVESYIEKGNSCLGASFENAKKYYEKALFVCERAFLDFFDDRNYGFREISEFYEAYAKIIKCKIANRQPSKEELLAFDNAKASYTSICEEYVSALQEYASITNAFPLFLQ